MCMCMHTCMWMSMCMWMCMQCALVCTPVRIAKYDVHHSTNYNVHQGASQIMMHTGAHCKL
jgi:hypothetical protein